MDYTPPSTGAELQVQSLERGDRWRPKRVTVLGNISSEVLLAVAVAGLVAVAFLTGGLERVAEGGRETLGVMWSIWPRLLLGFVLAGFITVLLPTETIGRYLGEQSGLTGLLLAMVAGALTPGGPFIQFPIIAVLHRSGAGPGPLAAYLTAWLLLPIQRTIIWELPFLGFPFVLTRLLVCLGIPLLVGLSVPPVLRLLTPWLEGFRP